MQLLPSLSGKTRKEAFQTVLCLFQVESEEIKNRPGGLSWCGCFFPEICGTYLLRIRSLGPEPKLTSVTSRTTPRPPCSALWTPVLLAPSLEPLGLDPFSLPNRTFVFPGWINNPRPTVSGGKTLTQFLFLSLVFTFSSCPGGSGRKHEVLLLCYGRKGHFLRNEKNTHVPTRDQRCQPPPASGASSGDPASTRPPELRPGRSRSSRTRAAPGVRRASAHPRLLLLQSLPRPRPG